MKKFIVALTALTLVSGAASAANMGLNERPGPDATPATAEQTAEVKAGDVFSPRELGRRDIAADAVVTVTSFPTSDVSVDGNSDR